MSSLNSSLLSEAPIFALWCIDGARGRVLQASYKLESAVHGARQDMEQKTDRTHVKMD